MDESMTELPATGALEESRCKRSDGKQWRCNAPTMPDKTVCEKHYIQAKKRSANSTLRANQKKVCGIDEHEDEINAGDLEESCERRIMSPVAGFATVNKENQILQSVYAHPFCTTTKGLTAGGSGEYFGRSLDSSSGAKGTSCHQCKKAAKVFWCMCCEQRGHCRRCISRWYSDISVDDIQKVCPACRGICCCKVCLQTDNLIKAKVKEISAIDKLRYLHSLLVHLLYVLKKIYAEQTFEIGLETRIDGPKSDIPRAKVNADEQLCCDFCKVPVTDYHRHCTTCLYDLCLACCHDLRSTSETTDGVARSPVIFGGEPVSSMVDKSSAEGACFISTSCSSDASQIDFRNFDPMWKCNSDLSILCAPSEIGGCGSSRLELRRLFKMNWIAKLIKNSEEMVNGCIVKKFYKPHFCRCKVSKGSEASVLRNCNVEMNKNNLIDCPVLDDLEKNGMDHFREHWVHGEPVIVRHAFQHSLSSSWDPLTIWRGIEEAIDEKIDENITVKAMDCDNWSEIDIKLYQFIGAYTEGHLHDSGLPKNLTLKNWPSSNILEEFLLSQRPKFLVNFPFVEFIHYKWGLLNLAAKLPGDAAPSEMGFKLLFSVAYRAEPGGAPSATNLMISICDKVYMLMHTAEPQNCSLNMAESIESTTVCSETNGKLLTGSTYQPVHSPNLDVDSVSPEMVAKDHKEGGGRVIGRCDHKLFNGTICDCYNASNNTSECAMPDEGCSGVLWDVFRRQDVSKLNEYIKVHFNNASLPGHKPCSVRYPIYDQAIFLDNDHKRALKDEYGVVPWTFMQHVGDSVFIPAGSPFQVKNFQSSVQLALDFLLPESLQESLRMIQEIRCLSTDHDAKLNMLEVGKISMYAASSAIKEIQNISLDPMSNLEKGLEDSTLTLAVSENLVKMTKRRQTVRA